MIKEITLLIPIHRVDDVTREWVSALLAIFLPVKEILLIDNASGAYRELLEIAKAGENKVSVLKMENNVGWGGAVLAGAHQSNTELVAWVPSNGKVGPVALDTFLRTARRSENHLIKARRIRKFGLMRLKAGLAGFLHSILGSKNMFDSGGTPSLAPTDFLRSMDRSTFGPEFDALVMWRAHCHGLTIDRPRVPYTDSRVANSSWRSGVTAELRLFSLISANILGKKPS